MTTSSELRVPEDRTGPGAPTGPSGWHPDPWQRHHARFFDGRQWSEHVADGGIAGIDSTPVAELARSRPVPPDAAPPDGDGPRVLDGDATAVDGLDQVLLLADLEADTDGVRRLRTPFDVTAGRVVAPSPPLLTRLGRRLVSSPGTTPTTLVVADHLGREQMRLVRPGRRTAPTVEVTGPEGRLGTISAQSVRRGLRALLVDADGTQVGLLEQVGPDARSLRVADGDDRARARLTPVWDIPGSLHHLPPGVVLIDRRDPDIGPFAPPTEGRLLLGALLAPLLLLPPGPPPDR